MRKIEHIEQQIRELSAREIMTEAAEEAPRRINLPFTEADLLKGLDAYSVHADELALPSPSESSYESRTCSKS